MSHQHGRSFDKGLDFQTPLDLQLSPVIQLSFRYENAMFQHLVHLLIPGRATGRLGLFRHWLTHESICTVWGKAMCGVWEKKCLDRWMVGVMATLLRSFDAQ